MTELLSSAGKQALQAFVTPATLFAFDLDGTLAPIVDDPATVYVPKDTRRCLARLSEVVTTAVITGRACDDALPRLGFQPAYLVGNHGSEGLPGLDDQQLRLPALIHDWHRQLQRLLEPQIWAALFVELKNGSLSLHYRHAPRREAVHAQLLAAIERLTPAPRRVGGKFVENLLPVDAPHKGEALLRLLQHSGCHNALFIGDDVTDEDVFRLDDRRIFSVCVGTGRPTAARFYLPDQTSVARLLEKLLTLLTTTHQLH